MNEKEIRDILTDIAIDKNAKAPSNVAYHGTGARFYQYDPSFALTGEGFNKYGRGFYSGSTPEIGEFYKNLADSQGKSGTVYQINLPEQYKYYNTDLPLREQTPWVQERLKDLSQPVDVTEFSYDLAKTNRFDTLYDDFFKSRGYYPKYTNEMVDFVNEHPERYMKEIFNPMGASSGKYSQLNRTLKDLGIAGTTHYKPNGANINITFDPKDIDIIQPNEVGPRMTAKAADVNKTFNELLKGYRRAFNPINRTVLQNPYTKAALRALGTTAGVAGGIGDAITIYDTGSRIMNKYADWYDKQPESYKELNQHNLVVPSDFAPKYSILKLEKQSSDFVNNLLPFIQLNEDGSVNRPLQGRVNYDDYMLEPLGDDVYMQRMPEGNI